MSHEDGKVGQVTARASGVALIGFQQFTTLSGPVSHHAPLWVIPEGTVGIVIMFFLQNTKAERGKKLNIYEYAQLKHVSHVFTSPFFRFKKNVLNYLWRRKIKMVLIITNGTRFLLYCKRYCSLSCFLTAWLYSVVRVNLRGRLTSRCSSVKITGSATNTRLDSFVIEADRMWELTVRERLCLFRSPIPRNVAFSVLRNWPRCL